VTVAQVNLRGVSDETYERLRLAAIAESTSVPVIARRVLDEYRPALGSMSPATREELRETWRMHRSMIDSVSQQGDEPQCDSAGA
jgi:hypothetical protein